MVTGEPPSTLDGGQCKVTVDFEAEVNVRLDGGAGGTPLLRLTANIIIFVLKGIKFTKKKYEFYEYE